MSSSAAAVEGGPPLPPSSSSSLSVQPVVAAVPTSVVPVAAAPVGGVPASSAVTAAAIAAAAAAAATPTTMPAPPAPPALPFQGVVAGDLDGVLAAHACDTLAAAAPALVPAATASWLRPHLVLVAGLGVYALPWLRGLPSAGQSAAGVKWAGSVGWLTRLALSVAWVAGDWGLLYGLKRLAAVAGDAGEAADQEAGGRRTSSSGGGAVRSLAGALCRVIRAVAVAVGLLWRVACLANVLAYLRTGEYASLSERLLRVRLHSTAPLEPGAAGSPRRGTALGLLATFTALDTLRRLLGWAADYADWGAVWRRIWRAASRAGRALMATSSSAADRAPSAAAAEAGHSGPCAWCGLGPAGTPVRATCGCTYCYLCLAGGSAGVDALECRMCGRDAALPASRAPHAEAAGPTAAAAASPSS